MTFRKLLQTLQQFATENPGHEALDTQVVVRVGVPNDDDDEDLHIGGLQSAVVDAGCTDTFALVLDADQDPDEDDDSKLIAEARTRCAKFGTVGTADALDLADQLEAALAEIERLRGSGTLPR